MLDFDLHGRCAAVIRLHVHLEDELSVVFRDEELISDIAVRPRKKTKLTEWFVATADYPGVARGIKYGDFPHHFTWGAKACKWRPSKGLHGNVIGRMDSASPLEGGNSYHRLLLTAVSGCTSYECVRKTPEGATCETSREAASARGLLREEKEYYIAFADAGSRATPRATSRIFASVLPYCSPWGPRAMWDSFYRHIKAAGSADSCANTVVQIDEDLRAAASSLAPFPTAPKIAQLQSRILTSNGAPEFETAPHRKFAAKEIPQTQRRAEGSVRHHHIRRVFWPPKHAFYRRAWRFGEDIYVQCATRRCTRKGALGIRGSIVRYRCVAAARR